MKTIKYIIGIASIIILGSLSSCGDCNSIIEEPAPKPEVPNTPYPFEGKDMSRVVAHRGKWSQRDPQNSITSVYEAMRFPGIGIELDLRLTKDSVLMVFHDDSIGGKKFSELTYKELRSDKYDLPNGEGLPVFEEILDLTLQVNPGNKFFLEFKSSGDPELDAWGARYLRSLIEKWSIEKSCYILTFDKLIPEYLGEENKVEVLYLKGDLDLSQLKEFGFSGFIYPENILAIIPKYLDESSKYGLKSGVWTINDSAVQSFYLQLGVDYLVTDEVESAVDLL